MASLTLDDIRVAVNAFDKTMRRFEKDNPHLFEPIQIIVVDDDGTEVDLCDISRPLGELMAEVIDER